MGLGAEQAEFALARCRLALIEPNFELSELLRTTAVELGAEFHCELLGERDRDEVTFTVMGAGSSIYAERSDYERRIERERSSEVRTRFLADGRVSDCSKSILKAMNSRFQGSSRLLPKTSSVILEISVIEINEGAPLLHEVVAFMASHGFLMWSVMELHRRPFDQALNQLDFLFVREGSPLLSDKRHR